VGRATVKNSCYWPTIICLTCVAGILNAMPCLIPIIAIFFPRLVMIGILIFTNWFSAAFATVFWPILGFLFMPYTTLAYMAAMLRNHHSVDGGWLVLVVVAVFVDLGGQGGCVRRRPSRA
jgi:hypothetical protein